MLDSTSDNGQSCIRFGKSLGIDLNQVITWKYVSQENSDPILEIFFSGTTFTIKGDEVDKWTFSDLHKALRRQFPNDLSPSPDAAPR